jgi:hypothetical protein
VEILIRDALPSPEAGEGRKAGKERQERQEEEINSRSAGSHLNIQQFYNLF